MALHRRTLNRIASTSVRSGILARGVGIGFALLAAGAGIAFVMQLCLARWLGATAYGTYTYVIAWSGLLAIAAGMGFPTLVLRVLPDYSIREDWGRVRGMLATSLVGTVVIGALIALLGITLVLSLGWQSKASVPDTVMGFVMVPLLALMALQQEMVRSFRRIGLAYAPSLLLRPSLVILGAACVLAFGHQLDSSMALALTATATVFVIGLQAWRFRRALGPIGFVSTTRIRTAHLDQSCSSAAPRVGLHSHHRANRHRHGRRHPRGPRRWPLWRGRQDGKPGRAHSDSGQRDRSTDVLGPVRTGPP